MIQPLKPYLTLVLLLICNMALAGIIPANPSTYRSLLTTLEPGDVLQLAAGNYTLGLPISNRHGTAELPIIIQGPETGAAAVFSGNSARNTVQIDNSSYIILRYVTMDGLGIPYVDAVNSRGIVHNLTLENLLIINHGGAYVPNTDHQLTNGIANRGPAWDWTVRHNVIIGAGTGIYFGNSTGRNWPFVGGLIEHNLILDSLGYNMQSKHMVSRNDSNGTVPGMPTIDRKTVIRHNVFSKANNSSTSGTWARPNLLVGHWPLTGAGSNDIYEIYGNLFFDNPAEALFQGEGNIAMYNNVMVNHSGSALHIQQHNDRPRTIRVFHNSIVATGTGIRVVGVDTNYNQLVTGNAVFAGNPFSLSGQVQRTDNVSDAFNLASNYLNTPFGDLEMGAVLDLYPLPNTLNASLIDSTLLQTYNDWDRDFNGNLRQQGFRGAYAGEGSNPGWQLELAFKPELYTSSQGAPNIIEGPVAVATTEGGTASFSIRAGGSSQIQYQWLKNGNEISGATTNSYQIESVATDDVAAYSCRVSNTLGANTSNSASLTVQSDTTAPIINGAVLGGLNTIDIQFSESVSTATAQTAANYQINQAIQVISATLSTDMQTVRLQTDTLQADNIYTVTVNNIRDASSNANEIRPASRVSIVLEPNLDFENGLVPTGWAWLTESRWSVVNEGGDDALFLNTSDYVNLSGGRLGEYILAPDTYTNFSLTVDAKTDEPIAGNANADYALVFGFQNPENYYYMLFNRTQSNTSLFKVVNGNRQELAVATDNWLTDNQYHTVEVRRLLDNIEVRFDENIVLQVIDNTFSSGQIGLGSFNDSVYFDNVRISASSSLDLIFTNGFE